MIKNWLLTALRGFRKNKTSSAINILGLTVGLSSCLLIMLFIRHEISYDDFEVGGNRIARVIMGYRFNGGGEIQWINATSTKVATTFQRTFPEIEAAVRMTERGDRIVSVGEGQLRGDGEGNGMRDGEAKGEGVRGVREGEGARGQRGEGVRGEGEVRTEKAFMFADSSFFNVFSFPLLEGDPHTALSGPHKVILTQSTARRYFGGVDPLGKLLHVYTDSADYLVTGVMADCPSNSQFTFDFLASFSSLYANQDETYWNANYGTFLLLRQPADFATLQPKITTFMKKEMEGQGAYVNFLLEPFMRIHLYSDYVGFEPGTSITYIYILAGVALLILVIACFTYINLSTARSVDRAREVGVRKVIGAGKGQLFWQFIGESLLLCGMAVMLSLVVVVVVLPAFNSLAGRQMPVSGVLSPAFIGMAVLIAGVVGLLAGSYPALVLSKFQPVKVLKGAFKNSGSGRGLRQSLIVFQFVISVFLIVSTFIMQRQLSYIRHRSLGYDREHVLQLPMSKAMLSNIDYIKTRLRANPDVLSLTHCNASPVDQMGGYNMRSSTMPAGQQLAVFADPVDADYIRTMGLQLVAGKDFTAQDMRDAHPDDFTADGVYAPGAGERTREGAADTRSGSSVPGLPATPEFHFILNEQAARDLGWTPAQAIGRRMFLDDSRPGYVIGVVKDFNFQSLHSPIKGLVFFPEMRARRLLVRVTGERLPETLRFLGATFKQLEPGIPYEVQFLDENYNKLYAAEQRLGIIMNLFSGIAIVLACLGLFGLSSYAAKQRVREIGIRKVLGASLGNLAVLLTADFIRLALVAIALALPLAWWAMRRWLEDYVYRTAMDWWIFALAALLVMGITLATVSIQAVKTALLNPVKNLKAD
jgi:putative ABC transport system permease protein